MKHAKAFLVQDARWILPATMTMLQQLASTLVCMPPTAILAAVILTEVEQWLMATPMTTVFVMTPRF
jgi:hypothetical protein